MQERGFERSNTDYDDISKGFLRFPRITVSLRYNDFLTFPETKIDLLDSEREFLLRSPKMIETIRKLRQNMPWLMGKKARYVFILDASRANSILTSNPNLQGRYKTDVALLRPSGSNPGYLASSILYANGKIEQAIFESNMMIPSYFVTFSVSVPSIFQIDVATRNLSIVPTQKLANEALEDVAASLLPMNPTSEREALTRKRREWLYRVSSLFAVPSADMRVFESSSLELLIYGGTEINDTPPWTVIKEPNQSGDFEVLIDYPWNVYYISYGVRIFFIINFKDPAAQYVYIISPDKKMDQVSIASETLIEEIKQRYIYPQSRLGV